MIQSMQLQLQQKAMYRRLEEELMGSMSHLVLYSTYSLSLDLSQLLGSHLPNLPQLWPFGAQRQSVELPNHEFAQGS
jgi:hypothetical protein